MSQEEVRIVLQAHAEGLQQIYVNLGSRVNGIVCGVVEMAEPPLTTRRLPPGALAVEFDGSLRFTQVSLSAAVYGVSVG